MPIDWSACPLVQRDPNYVSGQPALRSDPRMTVEPLVESADLGMSAADISDAYGVPADTVRSLLAYAAQHRAPAPV